VTRALVHGAGRMAGRVLAKLPEFPAYELAGVVSRTRPDDEDRAVWFASLEDIKEPVDLLIDFTLPGGTRAAAKWCASNGTALLSGTTGLTDEDIQALQDAALKVPVLWAPNLSQGIALMSALLRQTAEALGEHAKIAITDIHHIHKVDAPSGTALALSCAVLEGRSRRLQGPGHQNDEGEPVITSVREGEVIGEHTVSFVLSDEEIEITHRANTRDVFAKGALNAGEWLVLQEAGYYSTNDWLGLD
jgi:4-hydroxy-tetrahydrodipicolinate reductase